MKKIALIGNAADTMIRYRGPMIKALKQQGLQVFALVPNPSHEEQHTLEDLGCEVVSILMDRTGLNPLRDSLHTLLLAKTLHRIRPHITFCYFIKPVVFGNLAALIAGVPKRYVMVEGAGHLYSEHHTPHPLRRKLLRAVANTLYRISFSVAERVFVLNQDDEQLFIQSRLCSARKITRLNSIGISLRQFRFVPIRQHQPFEFVMLSRLLKEKGVQEYVQAARELKSIYPQARFTLLGQVDDNPGSHSRREVARWAKEGIIEWHGWVDNVKPWLDRAQVMVFPSYYREGVPRNILEAMACGRAVITTDWVGCKEPVVHGSTGLLVPIKDSHALANAMRYCLENPQQVKAMGLAGRQRAEQRYAVQHIHRKLFDAMSISTDPSETDSERSGARLGVSLTRQRGVLKHGSLEH